jgi:hypothetical protein
MKSNGSSIDRRHGEKAQGDLLRKAQRWRNTSKGPESDINNYAYIKYQGINIEPNPDALFRTCMEIRTSKGAVSQCKMTHLLHHGCRLKAGD